ncbi:MAG: NAD(P)H-dependent oxidoreductase subunit E [Pirellulaceae bacterium]|nr:NAD(P)H-dependent oxidoreductase subunit E [Planctomycetaceae bacterium]HIM28888.1 NAD(P)H-dependent oxidoreductase subunit E [Planctomycetota bacterium]
MNTADFKVLTGEMVEQIEALLPRYPNKQAVTLPAVHIVNAALRHVPLQAVVEIAEILELAPAEVQDTLTFYGFFKQDQPHGRTRAWICRSISCHLRGGDELLDHLCQESRIRPGETTEDGSVTIEYAECLGACEHAPCILAGDELHKSVTKEDADRLLASWK